MKRDIIDKSMLKGEEFDLDEYVSEVLLERKVNIEFFKKNEELTDSIRQQEKRVQNLLIDVYHRKEELRSIESQVEDKKKNFEKILYERTENLTQENTSLKMLNRTLSEEIRLIRERIRKKDDIDLINRMSFIKMANILRGIHSKAVERYGPLKAAEYKPAEWQQD